MHWYKQSKSQTAAVLLFSLNKQPIYFSHTEARCVTVASGRWHRGNRG